MTAINIILKGDQAFVLSDGAGYKPDGTLVSIQQKVFTIAHLNMAVAIRGSTSVWPSLVGFLNELHDTFDDVVERFPETYQLCRSSQPDAVLPHWDEPHEILIVGVSESRGAAEAYCIVNTSLHGLPVGEMIALSEGLVIPADQPFLDHVAGSPFDPAADDWDPEVAGLQLLEAQRARAWPLGMDGEAVHAVGGFAQLTTVRPAEVSSRILARWPDQIGERIGGTECR